MYLSYPHLGENKSVAFKIQITISASEFVLHCESYGIHCCAFLFVSGPEIAHPRNARFRLTFAELWE